MMSSLGDATNTMTDVNEEDKQPEKATIIKKRLQSDGSTKENEDVAPRKKQRLLRPSDLKVTQFTAPVLWSADAGADGKALFVDEERCIIGTNDGRVIFLDHNGSLQKQWRMFGRVSAVFEDGGHVYAWSHSDKSVDQYKGSLYEIINDGIIHLFDLVDFGEVVKHACMYDGCLVLSDNRGSVAVLNVEGDFLWQVIETDVSKGLLHADETGVYITLKNSVKKYDLKSSAVLWEYSVSGLRNVVKSAAVYGNRVYVEMAEQIFELDKETGDEVRSLPLGRQRPSGIVVGGGYLITGCTPTLIFDLEDGKDLYSMNFVCRLDDAVSVLDERSGRMYSFWDRLYCVDMSESAVQRSLRGLWQPSFQDIKLPRSVPLTKFCQPETTDNDSGIVVECVEIDGVILANAISEDYDDERFVAVPMSWREHGRRFVVEALEDCEVANCYRPIGNIRLLPGNSSDVSLNVEVKTATPNGTPISTPSKPSKTTPTNTNESSPVPNASTTPQKDASFKSSPQHETMLSPQFASITIPTSPDLVTPPCSEKKKRRRTGTFLSTFSMNLEDATSDA